MDEVLAAVRVLLAASLAMRMQLMRTLEECVVRKFK